MTTPADTAKLLEASHVATSAESARLRAALREALDLFDANWCPAHGHAPTPEAFKRAAELSKLIGRDHSAYDDLIGAVSRRRPR